FHPPTTELYPLSLHDALPISINELDGLSVRQARLSVLESHIAIARAGVAAAEADMDASVIRASEDGRVLERMVEVGGSARVGEPDRKSTRLNSSHQIISYAVF